MIAASLKTSRTFNPIRAIVDSLKPPQDHPKTLLNLALGDPTAHGLSPPSVLIEAVKECLESNGANGYLPSTGSVAARRAVAQFSSLPGYSVSEDDVIIASGCSGALELVISALIDPGDNLLVPRPGFPLYQVLTDSIGGYCRFYALLPESDWECDILAMESLIDSRTKAILINNPSNPCGSNFTKTHLSALCALAHKHNLPIIADEIYSGLVYEGEFFPAHTCCESAPVPVISVGGLAKEFCVPGWRVGWVVLHDSKADGRLDAVRKGLKSLTQLIVGASSLIQGALPRVLTPAAGGADAQSLEQYRSEYKKLLLNNSLVCCRACADCPEIQCVMPKGAMYAMLRVDIDRLQGIKDDADFAQLLLVEQNLVLLPGKCFGMDNYVRIITCPQDEAMLTEAFSRIKQFIAARRLPESPVSSRVVEKKFASPSKRVRVG